MMSRDGLYDLLVEAFDGYLDEVSQEPDRTRYDEVFVCSIDRVANGWSGDPAVMAEFLEHVPPVIGTPVEALRRPGDVTGLPRAFQRFVEKTFGFGS